MTRSNRQHLTPSSAAVGVVGRSLLNAHDPTRRAVELRLSQDVSPAWEREFEEAVSQALDALESRAKIVLGDAVEGPLYEPLTHAVRILNPDEVVLAEVYERAIRPALLAANREVGLQEQRFRETEPKADPAGLLAELRALEL